MGFIVENPNLGSFCAGFTGGGLLLKEILGGLCQAPFGFIQFPIDDNGRFRTKGGDLPVRGRALRGWGGLKWGTEPIQQDERRNRQGPFAADRSTHQEDYG